MIGWPYRMWEGGQISRNIEMTICANAQKQIVICDTLQPVAYKDNILMISDYYNAEYASYDVIYDDL